MEQTYAASRLVKGTDLRERIEAHQVGKVAMSWVGECVVFPLGDAVLTVICLNPKTFIEVVVEGLNGFDFRSRQWRLVAKFRMAFHHFVQELVTCLLCERGHIRGTMFGAPFVLDFVESVAVFRGDRPDEERALIHDGQGFLQELLVHRVLVVAPEVRTIPGSERLHAAVAPRRGAAKDVVLHSYRPSVSATLYLLGQLIPRRIAVRRSEVEDVIEERQVHLREIRRVGRPIVHLHIDVGMYVAMPERCVASVVPNALQVRRSVDARVEIGTYCEIAAILEVERFEEKSVATQFVLFGGIVELDEVFCRLRRTSAKLQVDAIHQSTMRSLVVGEE